MSGYICDPNYTVDVVQLVRMLDCDSGGRGFEPRHSPIKKVKALVLGLFYCRKSSCLIKFLNSFVISLEEFKSAPIESKIKFLYENGTYIMSIRYYSYKVNLYLLGHTYIEVFVKHKLSLIEKVELLDSEHTRMKFYQDQIKLPI